MSIIEARRLPRVSAFFPEVIHAIQSRRATVVVAWMTSGKKAETRGKRLASMLDMLEHGKKRVCCFDRSGMYGNNFSAPEAAE